MTAGRPGVAAPLPVTVEHRKVDARGLKIHCEEYRLGPSGGGKTGRRTRLAPPVLLLHGLGGSTRQWLYTAPDLARAGFGVYTLDLPGFGKSETPPKRISVLDYPRYVEALLEALDLPQVAVVGNSLGGYVAWLLAAQSPRRVSRLVLVDAAGLPLPDPLPDELKRLKPWYSGFPGAALIAPAIEQFMTSPETSDLTRSFARPYVEQIFADPGRVPSEVYEALHQAFKESRIVFLDRLEFVAPAPDFVRQLGSITTPTLIIWGERDALLPATDAGRFALLIPHARTVIYPGVGHVPPLEAPQSFRRDLVRFLRHVQ